MMHCYCGADKIDTIKKPDSNDYLCRECMRKHIAYLKTKQTKEQKDEIKNKPDSDFVIVLILS